MPDQDVSLHRVRGLVSGVNWRVTKFAATVPPQLTCGLCHVISRSTFLLPCLHTLCELCVSHSANDGNTVCPFDEESFTLDDCQEFQLPPATADKLKACCWNEAHGCTFVGTLPAVLTHYEHQCTFHTVTCPRCNHHVLQQDLPRHYRAGCHGEAIAPVAGEPRLSQAVVVSAEDIRRGLDELKSLLRDPYQDRLPALQSKMNEVLEEARNINTRIEAVARFGHESEHRLAQALGDLSTMFAEEMQSQQSALCANIQKQFQINEISEQVKSHGMRIDAIARTLSDQLAEAKQELSTTFAQKRECQRELCAQLKTVSELHRSKPGEAETTDTNEMPWRSEKRHILRKLELIATDSLAYLELLRTIADQQLKRPAVEYRPLVPRGLADTGKRESEGDGYIVSITNIDDVAMSGKFISLFTGWYRRNSYLQVAAQGWGPWLTVFLKWGTTEQGSCSESPEANVYVKHPDWRERQKFYLTKHDNAEGLCEHFGFHERFEANWVSIEKKKFVRDKKLTLVVSFKI